MSWRYGWCLGRFEEAAVRSESDWGRTYTHCYLALRVVPEVFGGESAVCAIKLQAGKGGAGGPFLQRHIRQDIHTNMQAEEYLIASRAIHIELERLSDRVMELAKFRCAELSNHAFLNIMTRQTELLGTLSELHDKLSVEFKNSSRSPLA